MSVDFHTVKEAYMIKERYGFSYWDSLILSAALISDCDCVFSEDMQDGQMIDNKLKIKNIFI
jgi:predicted nucleic acid-binding protein